LWLVTHIVARVLMSGVKNNKFHSLQYLMSGCADADGLETWCLEITSCLAWPSAFVNLDGLGILWVSHHLLIDTYLLTDCRCVYVWVPLKPWSRRLRMCHEEGCRHFKCPNRPGDSRTRVIGGWTVWFLHTVNVYNVYHEILVWWRTVYILFDVCLCRLQRLLGNERTLRRTRSAVRFRCTVLPSNYLAHPVCSSYSLTFWHM